MPATSEALGILLILLPGFTCAYIVEKLTARRRQSDLDKIIEAFLFSFLLYLAVSPFFGYAIPLAWNQIEVAGTRQYALYLRWSYLVTLAGAASLLALIYSANINHDWFLKLLRKSGITQRTARSTIWNDTFQDITASYVLVQLDGNRRVIGYVRYYSDDADENSLFLEDAAWVMNDDGEQQPIPGPGILLTKLAGIESISFLNARSS